MARRWRTTACALALASVAAGCTRAGPDRAPSDAGSRGGRPLRVTLTWDAPADLDLYVTTPRGETVYYANPDDAFVRDARCDRRAAGVHVEEARWQAPAPGRYRVGVDFPESCVPGVDAAPYLVVVDVGDRRQEHAGTARRLVREPRVFEVDIP